jgi:hypothetical protein
MNVVTIVNLMELNYGMLIKKIAYNISSSPSYVGFLAAKEFYSQSLPH